MNRHEIDARNDAVRRQALSHILSLVLYYKIKTADPSFRVTIKIVLLFVQSLRIESTESLANTNM